MKFTNAYDLVFYLYNQKLLKGFSFTGFYGEVIIESKIEDKNLVNLLESIWLDWSMLCGEETAVNIGDYSLEFSEIEGLFITGYCEENFPENKTEIRIDEILQSIINYLDMENIDSKLPIIQQIALAIEIDVNNKAINFDLDSLISDELEEEIKQKIKKTDIEILSNFICQQLTKNHRQINPGTKFKLNIESNHIYDYTIFWEEKYWNLKKSLGSIKVEFSLAKFDY